MILSGLTVALPPPCVRASEALCPMTATRLSVAVFKGGMLSGVLDGIEVEGAEEVQGGVPVLGRLGQDAVLEGEGHAEGYRYTHCSGDDCHQKSGIEQLGAEGRADEANG